MDRRAFLSVGSAVAAGVAGACRAKPSTPQAGLPGAGWSWVRDQFALSPDRIHMGALLLASNPREVRDAIARYRRALDEDPGGFLSRENRERTRLARAAAAGYLGGSEEQIALTDSTTMGIALVYQGLRLREGDEVLTTEHDYYATHEVLRQVAARTGAKVRRIALFERAESASADEVRTRIAAAIGPATRALALTWVHSSTGLRLPIPGIAEAVAEANRGRDEEERVLLCVDGVHGFGIENVAAGVLGCDFFMAGCHKWLFGPRGTGIVWGRPQAWPRLRPTIASFLDGSSWTAWGRNEEPPGPTTAARVTPGGFKAFEHVWALADAFEFHRKVDKSRIEARTHELAGQLKQGLRQIPGVTLHTPLSADLSSGIVCFDVAGMTPRDVVGRLEGRGIVATTTPYVVRHARFTPCIYNTPDEVERVVGAVRELAVA